MGAAMKPLVLSLSAFVTIRDDPKALILDARDPVGRRARPLINSLLPVVYAPAATLAPQLERLAALLGPRHVIVVDEREEEAADDVRLLRSIDIEAAALQNGFAGWQAAVVEAGYETQEHLEVVTLERIAYGARSYLLTENGETVVIDPSGHAECFLAELERYACAVLAIVDTEAQRECGTCGPELAAMTGAEYVLGSVGTKVPYGADARE